MRKIFLIFTLLVIPVFVDAQSSEDFIFKVASRLKIYLPQNDMAVIDGSERYIQLGLSGTDSDIHEMIGSMDRFVLHDKDMIIQIETLPVEEEISWFKFYLSPLADPNDFQLMLEMHKFDGFYVDNKKLVLTQFSNTVFNWVKEKNKLK